MEKEGYETVLAAATTWDIDVAGKDLLIASDLVRVLDEKGSVPPGMVRVSGAQTPLGTLNDFFIDRYEVTNRQYKEFIDSGGYRNREYWKHEFIKDGWVLTWEEAIAKVVDQTGRPGPATWQAGDCPEGQDDYPVSGISWYEAAAYAAFVGKSLPTGHHWGMARGEYTSLIRWPQLGGYAVFAPFSNFEGNGPVAAGSLPGITSYGAYDMAGNVKAPKIGFMSISPSMLPMAMSRSLSTFFCLKTRRLASALNHPNIATIYEIDEAPTLIDPTTNRESRGQMFIAMEYIEGRDLKSIIDTPLSPPSRGELKGGVGRPLPIDDALNYATQIAEGLQAAHEKGIVHRDIKPANLLLTERGQVKIVDFGLAKLAGPTVLTKDGTTLGTVADMSPEQTQGTDIDHRADIWALGAVLYEMITGRQPFEGGYEQAVMYSIMNEDPEPITGLRTGVPMELERIVNKALAKKPEERYQHVDEMQTDLKNLSKQFAPASGVHPQKIVDEKHTKKRLKIVAIPVGILLMLVLGFFLMRPLLFEEVLISEPKPIAVISFENQTGDKAYDYLQKAIPNLLITSLEQSKYLRVTTWERMYDLLKQMGKNDVEIIDKNLGFELCRLDGINTIVISSFVKAGNIFATDVKMLDVTTKRIIKSTSSKGKGVGSILDRQIDELSKNISRGVGLSKRRIEAAQMRIADVTTTSMDAYNSFLKGRESLEKYYYDNARQLLEQAVQLDSTFAVAQFYLAWVYGGLGNLKAMVTTYEKAKTLAKKATEKERLYIDYAYAYAVERNQEKQFRILKRLIKEYPKEKRAHYYLGILNKGHKFFD